MSGFVVLGVFLMPG